ALLARRLGIDRAGLREDRVVLELLRDRMRAVFLRERLHADPGSLEQTNLLIEDDVVPELGAPVREERGELLVALPGPDEHEEVTARLEVVVERGDGGLGERLPDARDDDDARIVGDLLDRRQEQRLDLVVLLLERELRRGIALGVLLGTREGLPEALDHVDDLLRAARDANEAVGDG